MSTPDLHALANAISNSSPAIKKFAQAVADVVQPATPPSTHVGNGFILFRYGSSWTASPVSGYERYGVVVVGYGNDSDAAKLTPPAHGSAYRLCTETWDVANPQPSLGGVSFAQVSNIAHGLYTDSTGAYLHPQAGVYACDLGNPQVQQLWIANVAARLATEGLHALFMDNCVPSCWFGTPANTYGGLSFHDGMLSFVKALRAGLPNTFLLANAGPGGTSWAKEIAPYVDGALYESAQANVSGAQAFAVALQDAGREAFWLGTNTDPASPAAKALATSFKSVWNGKGGGLGFDYGQADPWNTNWTSVVAP